MSKPIMEPGRPGDLVLIIMTARNALTASRLGTSKATPKAIALATHQALEMWLGLRPVAEIENE